MKTRFTANLLVIFFPSSSLLYTQEKMKAKDLPIYDDPFEGKEVRIIPDAPTAFTKSVTSVRTAVFGFVDATKVRHQQNH